MLKTSGIIESATQLGEGIVRVGSGSRVGLTRSEIDNKRKIHCNKVDNGEVEDDEVRKKVKKTSKSKNLSKSKKTVRIDFFTPGAKLAFPKLRQAFLKVLIIHHFDPERYIRIKTDI